MELIILLKIESLQKALETGEIKELPAVTFQGGYPLFYLTSYNNVYCPDCANKILDASYEDIIIYGVHWEGDSLFCENGHEIQSAYGNPEED